MGERLCEGRVVIVTGAGRGLGCEYAIQLARSGAKVVVNDLGTALDGQGHDQKVADSVVQLIREEGGEAVANYDDVSDWNGAQRLIQSAVEAFGRLDVLINNAGILRDRVIVNMDEAGWDDVIRVHLKGTFAPCHHAAVYWRQQHKDGAQVDARIINTTSTSGLFGNIGQANYGAAKAGIAAFTIIAARELKRYGITVNAITPHAQTRMTEGLRERTAEEIERRAVRWVAPTIVWLASRESGSLTGRVIEAGAGYLAFLEGWHRGPTDAPSEDPRECGRRLMAMFPRVRLNADMSGKEVD